MASLADHDRDGAAGPVRLVLQSRHHLVGGVCSAGNELSYHWLPASGAHPTDAGKLPASCRDQARRNACQKR